MARLCVRGTALLYRFLPRPRRAIRTCGKLIVATTDGGGRTARRHQGARRSQRRRGHAIAAGAAEALGAGAGRCPAPRRCSPPPPASSTATASCSALQGDAEAAGALLVFYSPVAAGRRRRRHHPRVGGEGPMELRCRLLVNSAGLHAPDAGPQVRRLAAADRAHRATMPRAITHRWPGVAVLPPDLSGAGGRRAGGTPDHRPRRAGAVRAGCRMDRHDRLRVDPGRADSVLCRGPQLLAGAAGWRRCNRDMPGFGRKSCRLGRRGRTLWFRLTPFLGWFIYLGSRGPGLTAAIALAEYVGGVVGASPRTPPGGFAPWTPTKGFAPGPLT